MRRFVILLATSLLIASLWMALAGCQRRKRGAARTEAGAPGTSVNVADPNSAVQLLRGFHNIENNAWRWTRKNFTVYLKTPPGAAQRGATLELQFVIPETLISQTGPLTLAANVGSFELAPQTYAAAGAHVYSRAIPSGAFAGDGINVDFTVNKGLAPGPQDPRELALVVSRIQVK